MRSLNASDRTTFPTRDRHLAGHVGATRPRCPVGSPAALRPLYEYESYSERTLSAARARFEVQPSGARHETVTVRPAGRSK